MRAVISGAGIAGLTLAWWLQRDGWEVVLVEHAPGPRQAGYMIDFFGPGYAVAERMDLLPRLGRQAAHIDQLVFANARGRPTARLSYAAFAHLAAGRVISVMRGALEQSLFEHLAPSADIRFGRTIARIAPMPDRVEVVLDDGAAISADLLAGADGIHSRVRRLAFGAETGFLRYLGYQTAAFVFEDAAVHAELGNSLWTLNAPGIWMGFYPLDGATVATFFAHRVPDPSLPGDPCAALARACAGLGWIVPGAIARCRNAAGIYYDQVAQIRMQGWHRGRVVLLGDSCQAVSLLVGQGASMAMFGAYVLAQELHAGGVTDAAFARYEARMMPPIQFCQANAVRFAGWMIPDALWRLGLRNAMLNAARLPGLAGLLRPLIGLRDWPLDAAPEG